MTATVHSPIMPLAAAALPLVAAQAAAQTDRTMGAMQSLSGRFTAPQSLGTVKGANLFHGFTRFSIVGSGSHVHIGGRRSLAPRYAVPGLDLIQAATPDGVDGTPAAASAPLRIEP